MSQLEYLHGCNKRRKRSSADQRVFRFKSFCEPGYPAEFNGPFWKNVRTLLEFGHMENNHNSNGMISWSFQLEVHRHRPDHRVFLFIIEEPIEASISRYCKHCCYIGWGQHMISNMKYHFVVPSKETAAMASTCLSCQNNYCCDGTILATRCGSNSCSLVELEGHTLHGVFHCNGFGHLLCVNGLEMGSDLSGHQIMDFWDRICTSLRARKVSLTDVSQKKSMELRLLHGLAYGGPWFARWEYKFGRGSFGVTESMYQKSIHAIQNIPLCLLFHHLTPLDNYLPIIFSRYQALSEHSLITLSDLFYFMLELRSRLPKEAGPTDIFNPGILLETSCRWSPKRVEMATRVIVEALKRAEPKWVSRQEVRDAARAYIGDTGLLDFVLKSLGNHVVGKYLVRRSLNPVTKVLEYCLEDISVSHEHGGVMVRESKSNLMLVTRVQLAKDILYLYKSTLRERKPMAGPSSTVSIASRVIHDSKHLVKEFGYHHHQNLPPKNKFGSGNELIDVFCALQLKDKQLMLPYELVQVKGIMTIEEFKMQVEKWFKDMYLGLNGLVIRSIANLNANDNGFVSGVIEEGKDVVLEAGVCHEVYENGNGMVMQGWNMGEMVMCQNQGHGFIECGCGTKEDDGERMVACDICEVWQHTRCVRIPNNEEVPRIFLCDRCEQDIVLSPLI